VPLSFAWTVLVRKQSLLLANPVHISFVCVHHIHFSGEDRF